jgi:hypothetical protein
VYCWGFTLFRIELNVLVLFLFDLLRLFEYPIATTVTLVMLTQTHFVAAESIFISPNIFWDHRF